MTYGSSNQENPTISWLDDPNKFNFGEFREKYEREKVYA